MTVNELMTDIISCAMILTGDGTTNVSEKAWSGDMQWTRGRSGASRQAGVTVWTG